MIEAGFNQLWMSFMVLMAGAGLGRLGRRVWMSGGESTAECLVVDASLGLGLLSLVMFGFGAAHAFHQIVLVAAVILGASTIAFGVLLSSAIFSVSEAMRRNSTITGVLTALVLLVLALAVLIPALAPPSMGDWDSLAYHLAVPKLFIRHGGFYYIPFTTHSNFPFLTEMLYVPMLVLKQATAAKLMHYWMGVLLVAAVIVLVRRHIGPKAVPLAAIAVAGMPIVLWEATTAYVDLSTALYTVLSVHFLLNYLDTRSIKHLIGCAVSVGFAASTKMTALAIIAMLAVWLIADHLASRSPVIPSDSEESARHPVIPSDSEESAFRGSVWKPLAIFLALAALVCSPWYIKSIIYTGNPVYPFFYSIFGGRDWTQALANNYTMLQKQFGMGHSFGAFMFLPFDLTFPPPVPFTCFYDRPGLFVGPIFLVAPPMLFFARYGSRKLTGLLLFFIAQVAVWFMLSQQSRYLIPAFAILAVLLAALVYQDDKLRKLRWVLTAVFVAAAAFGIWTLYPSITSAAPVVLGRESGEAYLARTLDIYPAQKFMNDNLPSDARVALYGDTRGFYLNRDYVWADPGHNLMFTRDYASTDEFVAYLKSKGVTHLMVNFGMGFPPREKARGVAGRIYEAIDQGRLSLIFPAGDESPRVGVYEVR